MFKKTIAAFLLASTAQAGDFVEGYFYIIGAVPSNIPAQNQEDFARKAFRARVGELSAAWSAECGADVFAWNTNLMTGEDVPFAPDMWVGILASGPSRAELQADMPDSPCATQGFIRKGSMVYPSAYQYCAFNEGTPEYDAATCD